MNRDWMAAIDRPRKTESEAPAIEMGLTGKMMLLGVCAGLVAAFLPLVRGTDGMRLLGDWRGLLSLLGYVGAAGIWLSLYLPGENPQVKNVTRAALGVGAVLFVLGAWLALVGWRTGPVAVGVNLFAAAMLTLSAVLKGIEEDAFAAKRSIG